MAQFQFKSDDRDEIRQERRTVMREEKDASSAATDYMAFVVRLMGVFMLIVGLWMGVKVIVEVWAIYRGPQHIERFADAIDKGSNLDKVLASLAAKKPRRSKQKEGLIDNPKQEQQDTLRISYFLAWIIVILLLMLIGRLAMAAIKTGGELALYDLQIKRFARLLMEEVRDPDKRKK